MTNTSVEILPLDFSEPAHCAALVSLMNEYITDRMGGGKPYDEDQKIRLVNGLKRHPSKLVLLARSGNHYIGLVTCFINFATFTVKPFINIHDVIVTEAWRDKGVGRRMLEKVIEKAAEMDCSKVTLEVREDNLNARHLYQMLGFEDAEPRQYYWAKYL
jgi:ribosomal protein S18 acetylase RimI-like enzyme